MPVVSFQQTGQSVEVPTGLTVLQAARQAGLVIESPCNSAGVCGKCTVLLDPASIGNVVQKGAHRLSADQVSRGFVLSCEAEIVGDIAVRTVPREHHGTLRILSHGVGRAVELDPFISKRYDAVADVTRVLGGDDELALEAGDTRGAPLFGVVLDIGTTTLSASLVDLCTGAEVACAGALNPQSLHAQDVLSRIRLASTDQGLQGMHAVLIEEIGRLIGELCGQGGIDPGCVYEIVFSGNTCMLHLAVRENPSSLGRFPYTSALSGDQHRPASAFGLPVAREALVYLPPVISAFVGPDISSGILATGMRAGTGTALLVDIGTNGEMVLGCSGRLFATSTAAGPAFEGMNISCGMRASSGAIEAFSVDSGEIVLKTIGDVEATGICGSGLMDVAAELVACGVVSANGRFCSPDSGEVAESLKSRLVRRDGKVLFRITDKVSVSQKDVRQIQLAKGAIRAGIEFLLREVGIGAESVERVLIAGSFGYHLRAESLLTIGLLPPEFEGKIEFVGNTSKCGGEAFLLNRSARREMAAAVKGIEVVELANSPDFDRLFVNCLGFPDRSPAPSPP